MPSRTDAEVGTDFFTALDYVVFASMLLISAVIGIYYALQGVHKCHKDFLTASRKMHCMPVALSLTASFMSAVTVLGTPAEVYRFGIMFGLFSVSYVVMVAITAEIFLPIYYRLGITSAYEYLELRYNRYLRLTGTVMFIILTVLYTGLVIYSPSLALNQVTGFQLWGSVVATGIVCTFYCTLGGLKAVVWTDVFQFVLMIVAFLTVIIRTIILKGGLQYIINDARKGGRLVFFDFTTDPFQRHSFWTIVVGGSITWLGIYGINQSQVQRYVACKSRLHAKLALYLNLVGLWIVLSCAVLCGLSMYSVFMDCDPWTEQLVGAPDQLMPYLVVEILGNFPGIPGLFVAGTYSGTLSTVSSSINALAAVTVEDIVKPHFKTLSDYHLSWISAVMNLLFGIVCLGMAAMASGMGAILQAALTIFGIVGGPLLGIFSLGILVPFSNPKGAFSGLVCGFIITMWVGIGSMVYPPLPHKTVPLHLSTAGCPKQNVTMMTTALTTLAKPPASPRPYIQDNFYSLSYLYFSTLGTVVTFIVGVAVSLSTGGLQQDVDPNLLFGKKDLIANYLFWKSKFAMLFERICPTHQVSPE